MRWFVVVIAVLLVALSLASSKLAADGTGSVSEKPLHEQVLDALRLQKSAVSRVLPQLHPTQPTFNHEAVIPPQCYTRTEGKFNPCYVCHQDPIQGRENTMNDGELQLEYSFSDVGMTNHWANLFEDRTERVAAISDAEIDAWVAQDNYSALPAQLRQGGFKGWIPDLENLQLGASAFDKHGMALDGSHWVAFNYKPLPSTFWPTNGATDDVMLRLPKSFRTTPEGEYSLDVYRANLAILEAMIKGLTEVSTLPVDEQVVGVDLDLDGQLGIARMVKRLDTYVGAAKNAFIDDYVYPKGTEFLHTVRYLAVGPQGEISVSTRMKEVRYMKKWQDRRKMAYRQGYEEEAFAKEEGRLPFYPLVGDWGLDNEFAWSVSGFIEGVDGQLRTATYEENLFCMGCHASIGSTIDKTFSFARKVDGAAGWQYINLKGMPDAPNMGETDGEILTYLQRVGGGGEFRSNEEMQKRWFKADGSVDVAAVRQAEDVYELIAPSPERARALNKAYRTIVADQDYIYGRDAAVTAPLNVYEYIENESAPTLDDDKFVNWDIRLKWGSLNAPEVAAGQ